MTTHSIWVGRRMAFLRQASGVTGLLYGGEIDP